MQTYGFVIPVFNHPHYLDELMAALSQYHLPIIVVNDGSHDECTMRLRALDQTYSQLHLIEHDHNQGKGQAVITGLNYAGQMGLSHALQLDADGQHQWTDIDQFLQLSQQHPDAVVIGQPVFDLSVPKKRLYGRYVTHVWVWINSLSFDIKDSMCGFRIYPLVPTLKILKQAKFQPRMGFDSEILVRLKWKNAKFINVPTPVIYPEHGISHFDVWRDNLGMSQAHARLFAGMLWRLPKLIKQKIQG
ncbi:glycosyltransferase family 2 protein [Acinetobacter ursingii]|uniref:glycosyltransferase family 2 protein n=1 Tax=Acinetobacter ursingii TaxID=108980 RepID=UPI001DC90F34|nr:glycosyltransferase family 2 protein [Acinetobacter ursingii]MCU4359258.1 glycosyltransferase family 2 protein [Acinetobacter ursingii]MEC8057425.1 glycosyltransferase family 2 protein [Pseudomonadota bacterium]NOZ96459.1 glycosyltransferase family 2 protein [Gammaproteobacteria bacterium]